MNLYKTVLRFGIRTKFKIPPFEDDIFSGEVTVLMPQPIVGNLIEIFSIELDFKISSVIWRCGINKFYCECETQDPIEHPDDIIAFVERLRKSGAKHVLDNEDVVRRLSEMIKGEE